MYDKLNGSLVFCLLSACTCSQLPSAKPRFSIERHSEHSAKTGPGLLPRPHQLEAVKAGVEAFSNGERRASIVMPGGSGKTLTGLYLIEQLHRHADFGPLRRVLVLLPRRLLVDQTLREYERAASVRLRMLRVHSGVSGGIPAPEAIAQWLKGAGDGCVSVVLSTYHSSQDVSIACGLLGKGQKGFGLCIFDEVCLSPSRLPS